MSADFGTPPDAATVPVEHVALLERLRRLAARMRARAAAPKHSAHHVQTGSADLTFDAGDRAEEARAIIGRHGGTVVSAGGGLTHRAGRRLERHG